MELWLKILTEHCHQDVINQYHQLIEDQQKQQFLEVLKGNVLTQNRLLPKQVLGECIVYEVKPDSYYKSLSKAIGSEGVEPNRAALDELPSWLMQQTEKYLKLIFHSFQEQSMRSMSLSPNYIQLPIFSPSKQFSHRTVDFSKLKKILIKDLSFGTFTGCYIEGKLVTLNPWLVQVSLHSWRTKQDNA